MSHVQTIARADRRDHLRHEEPRSCWSKSHVRVPNTRMFADNEEYGKSRPGIARERDSAVDVPARIRVGRWLR